MKTHFARGRLYVLFVVLGFFLQGLNAQEDLTPDLLPPSPTAASLGEYGEIPVSLYTGIPNITIPLWDIQTRDLSLSINLSYHAGGVKVEEIAPWTGLGWSLNAGGVITRTVRSLPDDLPGGYLNNGPIKAAGSIDEQQDHNYLLSIAEGALDTEPDLYYFNFAGRSGKFLFEEDGTIYPIPYEHLKIEKMSANQFKITDEDGFLFVFGVSLAGDEAYEVSHPSGSNNLNAPYVSSWYLTDIVSPSGAGAIALKYDSQGGHLSQLTRNETKYLTSNQNIPCNSPPAPSFTTVATVLDKAQKLSEIIYPNGKITFLRDGARADLGSPNLDYKLNSVVIYDRNNQEMRRFDLTYGYFNSSSGDYKKKRLKLLSVTEKDISGNAKPPYSFSYHDSPALPSRESKQQDHWGYFNGASINDNLNTLIPTMVYGGQNISGADRSPDFNKARAGTLKKITYPTGGHTAFEYELNAHAGGNAGGLRVRKITSHDGEDQAKDMIRVFKYEDSGVPSGKLVRPLPVYFRNITYINPDPNSSIPGANVECDYLKLSSASTLPLGTTQGGTVGYTQVSELEGTSGQNGKTDYEFSFIQDMDIYSTMDWHRGKLLRKTAFAKTSTGYRKVHELINEYDFSGSFFLERDVTALKVVPLKVGNDPLITGYVAGMFDYWESVTQCRWVILEATKERIYNEDGVGYVETVNEFVYDNYRHGQVTRSTTYNSDGRMTVSKSKFAKDYDPSLPLSNNPNGPVIQDAIDKHLLSMEIETQQWEGQDINSLSLVGGAVKEFAEVSGASNPVDMIFVPKSVWLLETDAPVADNIFTPEENLGTFPQTYATLIPGYSTGKDWYQKRVEFTYNSTGNLVNQSLIHGSPVSYIWGYNQQNIIAKTVNSGWQTHAYTSFEEEDGGGWTYSVNSLNPQAKTGTSSYNLSGGSISCSNLPAGTYTLSYWAQGSVSTSTGTPTANSGQDTDPNGWTYFEKTFILNSPGTLTISGSGKIDELRLHPSDAQMTTITYDHQLQINSLTEANHRPALFEYDGFGRLVILRDHQGNIIRRMTYNFQ